MKARNLIDGAGHAPEQLKIICEAFDDAWAVIAPRIAGYVTVRQAARLELANAILSLASEGVSDAKQLAGAALTAMSMPPTELK